MSFFNGWVISKDSRQSLLELFKPKWAERVVAAHITNEFVRGDVPLHPFNPFPKIMVIGMVADDNAQSLLVTIDDEFRRPDDGYFHCTWSLLPDYDNVRPVLGGQIKNPERGIVGWPLWKGGIVIEDCQPIWKGH
jgi:hypothetical protein